MSHPKDHVLCFLSEKGVENPQGLAEESLLLEHISSVDFMEMIVYMENATQKTLDMSTANIENIMTLGGFIQWTSEEIH